MTQIFADAERGNALCVHLGLSKVNAVNLQKRRDVDRRLPFTLFEDMPLARGNMP